MKKIPTLFKREYKNHKVVNILPEVTEGYEWVLQGKGTPTVKIDGSCCAIINGELYKRYDAKKGRKPPVGAIPCCEPDKVTGHHPHWVKCSVDNPADKWFNKAYENTCAINDFIADGTYEAIGKHFQGNPYDLRCDTLERHGARIIKDMPDRTFEGIKKYLTDHYIEGVVFWLDGEPKVKIKRSDFGLEWNKR